MSFVVEDGTGLATATSYVDVATADAYFANFNNTVWAALGTTDKEFALNEASAYFDLRWGCKLTGQPVAEDQALILPQNYLYTTLGTLVDGVPLQVQKAVIEYALLANAGTLYKAAQSDTGAIKSTKKKVGPIETQTVYQDYTQNDSSFSKHTKPDRMVSCYFGFGASGSCSVIRN